MNHQLIFYWSGHPTINCRIKSFFFIKPTFAFFSQENTSICTAKYLEAEKGKKEKEKEKENGKCLENTWKVEATCTAESNTKCTHSISQFIKIEQ